MIAPLPVPAPGIAPVWTGRAADVQTAADLVAAFFAGRNERTLRAYQGDLQDFATFLGAPSATAAADAFLARGHGPANGTALAYRADLLGRKLSPATVNRRLAALRSLVKLARTLGLVSWTLEVEGVRSERYRDTRGPGVDGVRALLQQLAARPQRAKATRDCAAVRLLHDLALRRGEVVSLDLAHVDLAGGTVAVLGKGRTERTRLTLPSRTRAALADWIDVRGPAPGPLFLNLDPVRSGAKRRSVDDRLTGTSLYRIVRELGDAAGLHARPHGLRHTAITRALDATNGDVRRVQRFSRHRDLRTLVTYDDNRADLAGEIATMVASSV